jgi:hypothetical protein
MTGVTTPTPVLPTAADADADAADYAGVRPATLAVWRHRYGLEPRYTRGDRSLYSFDELAGVLARRAGLTE